MGRKVSSEREVRDGGNPVFDTREQASAYRREHGGVIVEESGRFKVVKPD